MWYVASKILWTLGRPSTVLLAFLIAGLVLQSIGPFARWGRRLLAAGVAGLTLCAFLPLGTWLLRPLEDRFAPLAPTERHVDGIILLGGAIALRTSVDRGVPTWNAQAGRMTAFVALARRFPNARLVFSGGNADLIMKRGTEAEVARAFVEEMGLSSRRMVFEDRSRNTHENALFTLNLVHPAPGQRWLLVTSAADMPRAVGCFRAVGWPVIPAPVDYHTRRSSADWGRGLVFGLEDADWATHEWIGLVYYRFRGWTSSLFPGPQEGRSERAARNYS